jgi:uncharacterized membrane protein YhfC
MLGIYGMAVLALGVTTMLCIGALDHLTRTDRRYYWLILVSLPLSLVVNQFVKTPAIASLAAWTGVPLRLTLDVSLWFVIAIWLNAPIFEEAIKILPLILPVSRVFLRDPAHALWTGLALGMGFGIGEAAYLAYRIGQSLAYQPYPWHMFTGFAFERLIVTFAHGLLTALTVLGFHYGGRKALFGFLSAVGLHALINLGPILLALRLVPATVSSLATYTAILIAFLVFQQNERMAKKISGIVPREIIYFER